MASTEQLQLDVVTPTGSVLSVKVDSVQAPSVEGEFGVLPNHLPLLAALKCGLLVWEVEGKRKVAAIGPGFVEGGPDKVLLLTDLYATPEKIKPDSVRQELTKAEDALRQFDELYEGPEYTELQRDVDWAIARLDAYSAARAV
ncbi:MAG: ATP synthase F1 subunit epsilon [Myxococcales bacterium]|jgi:F-type H+-transporting ATPase subunit epsilon|nr:ATP synthase F1 subunit epsilon [Myxococcales bacterium]MDH3845117.1 ATP synthase F1 subunit epsilon [Myxococcales bacterium]